MIEQDIFNMIEEILTHLDDKREIDIISTSDAKSLLNWNVEEIKKIIKRYIIEVI